MEIRKDSFLKEVGAGGGPEAEGRMPGRMKEGCLGRLQEEKMTGLERESFSDGRSMRQKEKNQAHDWIQR